jgi:hypothetical protein
MKTALVVVAFDELVAADIPYHHGAPAVLAFRDDPLEIEVLERVVLGRLREPALVEAVRNTLWYGPRFEHAVHFEPEIVVKVARRMQLDNEPAPAALAAPAWYRRRFGRLREVPLPAVCVECF